MTTIAIISDIHANIHALEAVWHDVQGQNPDEVYCLGDLVGYGANPNEVIDFIREKAIPTIMGNYDQGVGFDRDDCGCAYTDLVAQERGQASLHWSREQTTADHKAWLRELPGQYHLPRLAMHTLMVHGSPRKINEYLFEDRSEAMFRRVARLAGCELLLFGHTHLPYRRQVNGTLFVNAGSVGKPGDGDPRAGYVMLTLNPPDAPVVAFHRVAYDVVAAAGAIRRSGLPDVFADLLARGGVGV